MQVTDELALLDQLMQAATYCAKHHDAAGLAEVVERLEQVSGSKFSSGKEARNATHRARLSLQHIGILSEGRLAAMRGQPAVLKELAKAAETCVPLAPCAVSSSCNTMTTMNVEAPTADEKWTSVLWQH